MVIAIHVTLHYPAVQAADSLASPKPWAVTAGLSLMNKPIKNATANLPCQQLKPYVTESHFAVLCRHRIESSINLPPFTHQQRALLRSDLAEPKTTTPSSIVSAEYLYVVHFSAVFVFLIKLPPT